MYDVEEMFLEDLIIKGLDIDLNANVKSAKKIKSLVEKSCKKDFKNVRKDGTDLLRYYRQNIEPPQLTTASHVQKN